MRSNLNRVLAYLLVVSALACNDDKKSTAESNPSLISTAPTVTTLDIDTSTFTLAISSNGKLEAQQKVDLRFENAGLIKKVFVRNGSVIRQDQLIASQDADHLYAEHQKAQEAKFMAELNTRDFLLGTGYKDTANVPEAILKVAKARAGLADANLQHVMIERRIFSTSLTAPFDGSVANVTIKECSFVTAGENVCTILNNQRLYVNFFILESEFGLVKAGDRIEVVSFSWPAKKHVGIVKQINPTVDRHGYILAKAEINNSSNELVDGMNVEVTINKKISGVISVPKKSIVQRQNRKVVFLYKSGRAIWRYIKQGIESSDSAIVIEGLKIGDQIITNGNVNLGHNAKVNLEEMQALDKVE